MLGYKTSTLGDNVIRVMPIVKHIAVYWKS